MMVLQWKSVGKHRASAEHPLVLADNLTFPADPLRLLSPSYGESLEGSQLRQIRH